MKKIFEIIKSTIFAVCAVLILVYNQSIANYLGQVVGAAAIFYGINGIIESILEKDIFSDHTNFFEDLVDILLGLFLMFVLKDKVYDICIVWAVWSILRETREMKELLQAAKQKRPFIISSIESVVMIVFSVLLVLDPEEHMHTHIILLSIEFFCQVLFKLMDMAFYFIKNKKKTGNVSIDV